MEPMSNKNLLPINAVDRMISSYTGGINTQNYYESVYLSAEPQQKTHYIEVNEDGVPIVYIQGQAVPQTTTVTKPALTPQETATGTTRQQTTTSAGSGQKQFEVMTPTGLATTAINAVFSIAVTIAIIMGIVVTYLIIRTKQLHHHEEHIRAAAPGHGGGHDHGHGEKHADVAHDHGHGSHEPVPVEPKHSESDGHGHAPHHRDDHEHHQGHDELHSEVDHSELPVEQSDTVVEEGETARGDTSASDISYRFDAIKEYIAGDDQTLWRHALMDIDLILDDALAQKGIAGTDTASRLASADTTVFPELHDALMAHAFYEQLVQGDVSITHESMQQLLRLYSPVLHALGL